jgi:hypothetical protein
MNPSQKAIEASIKQYNGEIFAMNVLSGGGASSVKESGNYLKSFNKIKYCTVGASSEEHLRQLKEAFI